MVREGRFQLTGRRFLRREKRSPANSGRKRTFTSWFHLSIRFYRQRISKRNERG